MITTDAIYNTLIASGSYEESVTGTLKDGSGATVLNISNEYIKTGSLIIDNKCINNDDLEPGAVYAAELKITITGNAGLTSSQKSSLQNGSLNLTYTITDGNSSSSISIGIYYIIEVTLKDEDVEIIAEDMMSRLSKNIPTAVREDLNFVARTPYELLDLCCQNCSTSRRPISLANDEMEFDTWSNADASFLIPVTADIATYRDLVAEVAKIMGCFATIDKNTNGLILKRLNPHSNNNVWNLNEDIRYRTEKSGYICRFGKVALGNTSYPDTSDEDVSGLILSMRATELTDDSELLPGIVQNLYNEMAGISYRPCKIEFMGNIALEVGDWIGVNYTEDGTTYTFRTIITHFNWILNGKELIESTGSSAATTKKVGSKGSGESRNSSSIDNLESRIETLESSGGGKEVYYGTSLPTADIGQDSSLYYKIIQRPEDLKTLNVMEYITAASGAYIPTDICPTTDTRIEMVGWFTTGDWHGFNKAFGTEGNTDSNHYGRVTVITSAFESNSKAEFWYGNDSWYLQRYAQMPINQKCTIICDIPTRTCYFNGTESSAQITVPEGFIYQDSLTPLAILHTNKSSTAGGMEVQADYRDTNRGARIYRFRIYQNGVLAYDMIPVINANNPEDGGLYDRIHRKYYPAEWCQTGISGVKFTGSNPTGEVINQLDECVEAGYLRVDDEWWEIYNGGTEYSAGNYIEITENNVITSTLKAGTNIQIADDGTISASAAEIVQTVTSGTELATINGTSIYAPTVSATQTQTSGTEIGNITINNNTTTLYAPPSSKIISHTTAEWESLGVSTVSESGVLYVYTDYKQDESGNNIPGFKMGDGNAYVADLPFSSAIFDAHMNNTDIHITAAEREKWNNKVSVLMNESTNNLFFITG